MAKATSYGTNYGDGLYNSNGAYGIGVSGTIPVPGANAGTGDATPSCQSIGPGMEHIGSNIDWNGLFQKVLESPDDTQEARLKKYDYISTLNNNFVSMAKQIGKIIIAETFLPDQVKTIKPYVLPGVAGGRKYLYNGILFKLQTDWKGIYGSDHNAMKSGSLELKGLMRYYGFHKIHVPLMAIIDYRGYRLLAESKLPISPATLHYGSADGGRTVMDGSSCPELKELMRTIGTTLNLAGHWCGPKDKQTFLYSPIDVEGHQGTDGRFYVIDLARIFPPTAEEGVSKSFLYQSFRPEFVRTYRGGPLSSDAFSKFVSSSIDQQQHNDQVKRATEYLLGTTVPEFADWLDHNPQAIREDHPLGDLTELAHREGINVRYLGLVRSKLKNGTLRRYALMELIARVMKNKLNDDLRKASLVMSHANRRGDENYLPIVLKFFNLILGDGALSDDWWHTKIKDELTASYNVACLSEGERAPNFSLRPLVDLNLLFKRVQTLTGVRFTKIVMEQLCTSNSFELVSVDIRKMGVRVKHMNITSQAQASALAIQAMEAMAKQIEVMQLVQQQFRGASYHGMLPPEARSNFGYDRLFNLSMMKYEAAIRSTPDNHSMLTHYASVLIRVGLLKTNLNESASDFFEKALQKLSICKDTVALLQLGELLQHLRAFWSETNDILSIACKCFEAVTSLDPTNAIAWSAWADTLVSQARVSHTSSLYTLAGCKYRQSIQLNPLSGIEWLRGHLHSLTDLEIVTAIELVGRKKQRRCDSLSPILESTPIGEPIHVNEQELANYASRVKSVSMPTDAIDHCISLDDSTASVSGLNSSTSILTLANPSPSLASSNSLGVIDSSLECHSQSTTPVVPLAQQSDQPSPIGRSIDASLVFNRNLVTSVLVETIGAAFSGLRSVRLSHCLSLPQRLPQLVPTLTELNIANTDANDRWIASIVTIPTLAKLDITNCQKLSHLAFKDIITKCAALTHLFANYFGGCKEPKLEPQIGFVSPSLQALHLAGFRASAESWCRLIACSTLSSLRRLALDECLEVNDAVLAAVGHSCPLTHLSLRSCVNVTNQGVESLVTAHLKHKSGHSHSSSGGGSSTPGSGSNKSSPSTPDLSPKPVHLKLLKYLDLSDCLYVTMHTLETLASHVTTLESLLLNGLPLFQTTTTTWLGAPLGGSADSNASSGGGSTTTSSSEIGIRSSANLKVSSERPRFANTFQRLIEANPHLCRLELSHTGVGDAQLAQILSSSGASIVQLKLISEAVTDIGLHSLAKAALPLQLLDLEHSSISDHGLAELCKASGPSLTALSLSDCSGVGLSDEGLIHVASHCPNLLHLDLSHTSVVTDRAVAAFAEKCKKLQRLNLVACRFITDLSIEAIGTHAHKLHYLNLSRCPCIISLGPLGDGCPELRELHVRGCEFISDDTPGFGKLANLRALRYLDFQGCHYITDITLGMLETDACPDLQVLMLGRNKIRDSHVQSLRVARRSLNVQNISDQPLHTQPMPRSSSLDNSGSVLSESSELAVPHFTPTTPRSTVTQVRGALAIGGHSSSVATKTLMNDLKAIQKNPVPYVSAQPVDDSNLYIWHGNLLGPENTPYAGAIFHIELVFPPDYPTNPPSATLFTPLPHPHVHKDHICLDILSDYKGYFSALQELERKDTRDLSGWHSSYTVQSILLSMQSFLMDMKENAHGTELRELMIRIPDSIRTAANFVCPRCPHRPGTPFPPIAAEVPQVSMSEKEIIAEELRCEHTRAPYTEDVLGICVEVTHRRNNGTIMNIGYTMQLLAYKAFLTGVRSGPSSNTGDKQVFMPLWIDEEHGSRAMPIAEDSIAQLYNGNPGAIFQPTMVLDVLTQLMKSMVVDLVKAKASINALQYYFAFHRLLIAFTRKYPLILDTANKLVNKFVEDPAYRTKRQCPDLGCLLMLLTITTLGWRDISQAYMQESFVRNAPRAMEKSPELATPHPDERVDSLRNEKTFLATRVSLGIAMLQVYFLEHIGRPKGVTLASVAANYDSLYGRLTVKVREDFLEAIKGINGINTWADTFKFLGLPPKPNEEITSWLRECVQLAIRAGYVQTNNNKRERNDSFGHHHRDSPGGGGNTSKGSLKNSYHGSGNPARSGSAKLNHRQDRDLAPPNNTPSRHGASSTTPRRTRSRASSNSSSSEAHAAEEFDVAEFDTHSLAESTASLPNFDSLPVAPVPLSTSAIMRPTPAWTGSNPVLDKHGKKDTTTKETTRDPTNLPLPTVLVSSAPVADSSTALTSPSSSSALSSSQQTPSVAIDDDDDTWIAAGRPRRKSKPTAPQPQAHQAIHGTPGRGLGRGQGPSYSQQHGRSHQSRQDHHQHRDR